MNAMHTLMASAETMGSRVALSTPDGDGETYTELLHAISKRIAELERLHLELGDTIAILSGNTVEFVHTYYAALALGVVVVPINPSLAVPEVVHILRDSGAGVLLSSPGQLSDAESAAKQISASVTVAAFGTFSNSPASDIRHPVSDAVAVDESQPAHIIYTSGTTGKPKGAVITHGNIKWMSSALVKFFEENKSDKVLCVLPLFHAYALFQCLLAPLQVGAFVRLLSRFDAQQTLREIRERDISVFFGVPTMFILMLEALGDSTVNLKALRLAVSGGASIPVEVLHAWETATGVEICEGYGLSEVSVMCICNPPQGEKRAGSIGKVLPGLEAAIDVDPGTTRDDVRAGELLIKGPSVMKEYWRQPETTKQAFSDHWLRTGDIAYQDSDGYFFIVDRKKDVYQRGGFNVYPREVEEVLYAHPSVLEAAVVGIPEDRYGEEGAAFVVLKDATSAEPHEFVSYVRDRLASYKVPRFVYIVERIPVGATGKVQKAELRATAQRLAEQH